MNENLIKIDPHFLMHSKMVLWKNVNNDTINDKSFHAGLPIISGVKYILVNWILTK